LICLTGNTDEEVTAEGKVLFKRITMNVSMAIWNFVSVGEQALVRQALTYFLPQIDQLQTNSDLKIAAGNFLSMAHGLVDKTEQKMLSNLQEYYDKHPGRGRGQGHHRQVKESDDEAKGESSSHSRSQHRSESK
jgi:hypothetical protein